MMKSFGSDNHSGIHPNIVKAITNANEGHVHSYGDDDFSNRAISSFKREFGEDIDVYFVLTGTGANVLSLQTLLRPFEGVICATSAHINVDECGAPEHFTGCKLIPLEPVNGKLTPQLIEKAIFGVGDEHHIQARVVSISQATELGSVYTLSEMKAICDYAHSKDLYVHLDGARLANACAALNCSLQEITKDVGIDILSFGGTKNGMMLGESIVCFRPELSKNLKYLRKMGMQLYSKMRFVAAQFSEYLDSNLWIDNAVKANSMARYLYEKLLTIPEITLTQELDANAMFLLLPKDIIEPLRSEYFFYTWDEFTGEIRLMCSYDMEIADIDNFITYLKKLLEER